MNSQALQHDLNGLLHHMQQQLLELNLAIDGVEQCLAVQGRATRRPATKAPHVPKTGGRNSPGWTEEARARVGERMRAYWREKRATSAVAANDGQAPPPPGPKSAAGRSTAGWTPAARAQAAARMSDRWRQAEKSTPFTVDRPCD